jgi:hypothetical protein
VSHRVHIVLGLIVAGLGTLGVVGLLALTATTSVRDFVGDRYRLVASRDGGRSREYTSPDPPSRVVAAIAGRWKPAERLNDPSGYFLRYRDDYVVVSSERAGGSRIYVDDEEEGYRHWYGHVGGNWGTYSGPAETVRGGGPGAGK